MKTKALISSVLLVCALGILGCKSKTTSTDSGTSPSNGNTATANSNPSDNMNNSSVLNSTQPGSSGADSSSSGPRSLFTSKPILVKRGTEIVVVADEPVSSKTNNSGDHFDASVAEAVVVGDRVVIPKGARASGKVMDAKSAGKFNGNAELTVALSSITVKGKKYLVKTTDVTESGKSRGKRTAVGAGGGAVVGGLIGALAGRGKGAAIGAAAGAGAGTAGAAMTGERDVTIDSESKLSFKLEDALEIERK